jgi:hypothetical protein
MSERSADAPTILICERHGFFLHASIGVQIESSLLLLSRIWAGLLGCRRRRHGSRAPGGGP